MSHWKTNFPRGGPPIRYVNDDDNNPATGTVTNVATDYGISGGPIIMTGTVSANLLSTTRAVPPNTLTPTSTPIDFATIVFDTLEAAGHLTYSAGTWTCVNAGDYKFSVTLSRSGTSAALAFIMRNAEGLLYKVLAQQGQSGHITMIYALVPGDIVTVRTFDSSYTTPATVNTNFVTVTRIA